MPMRPVSAKRLRSAFARLSAPGQIDRLIAGLTIRQMKDLLSDWELWARSDQLPPVSQLQSWRTWLVLGGRGAGKTRAGAEWVRAQALGLDGSIAVERTALVGETLDTVRAVMVEGVSGLLAIHDERSRPKLEISRRRLVWPNGAIAEFFSAEDPDSLRGPQFGAAWCDEICKWRHVDATFDMLQFGLRLGEKPRQVITTTPRALPLIKNLLRDVRETIVTRSRTVDNAANLAPGFLSALDARYGGTRLARQELEGEFLDDRTDGLWQRTWFDAERQSEIATTMRARTVVAVDPPVTAHAKSDTCGIVVAARGTDGRAYVLEDASLGVARPDVWATRAVEIYRRWDADCIVAEVNQGGDLVIDLLAQIGPDVPVRAVRATRGKWLRAEPVAALYARGLVSHVGRFDTLEDELSDYGPDGLSSGRSPDRMDALVWAMTELMLQRAPERAAPRIRHV